MHRAESRVERASAGDRTGVVPPGALPAIFVLLPTCAVRDRTQDGRE